jgi:hypothetical protein
LLSSSQREEAMRVICSVEEFLSTLNVGDQFWFLAYQMGIGPTGVVGPCTINGFEEVQGLGTKVLFHQEENRPREYNVQDLTNPYHGVFLTKEDATEYFNKRKKAYQTNPVLISGLERERDELEWFQKVWDQMMDEYDGNWW